MAVPAKRETKKPYTKPSLTAYGTVRELTLRQGARGRRDGGPRRTPRTHV